MASPYITKQQRGLIMKTKLAALLSTLMVAGMFASCNVQVTARTYYDCYPVYDYWGYYMYDDCGWYYYNDKGELNSELDIAEFTGDVEELKMAKLAGLYAEKFSLSTDKASQMAKNVIHFEALSDRSESDIADFAQKLYGVNPTSIAKAVAQAQVGNNSALDSVLEEAAQNFNTDTATMKSIVNELHGNALKANGIQL